MVVSGSSRADAAGEPLRLGDPTVPTVLRLWRTRIVVAREAEYQQFANERSLPMFRLQPGFLGLYFAGAGDERLLATLWESASAAAALDESPSSRSFASGRPNACIAVRNANGTTGAVGW
ncbi:hypothetical protein ACX9R5_00855 [Rathayibacter sp. CAU 1779]